MAVEIDVETEKAKYQAELDSYARALQQLEAQRAQLIQAIQERRGILIYLNSKNQQKETKTA